MSETDTENEATTGEHATRRTGQQNACRRCDREQGLVG